MYSTEQYIIELLHEHDCVVLPGFGGFVLNPVRARFASQGHELKPPAKAVSFNINLQHNDGLLVNHIALRENISYASAYQELLESIAQWKEVLGRVRHLNLPDIGRFYIGQESQWLFEPEQKQTFQLSSFGLSAVTALVAEAPAPLLDKEISKGKPTTPGQNIRSHHSKRERLSLVAVIVLALFVVSSVTLVNMNGGNERLAQHTKSGDLKRTAGTITTIINNSAPLYSDSSLDRASAFYVIGGSFSTHDHAKRFYKELTQKGYKAEVIDNENGYYRVAYMKDKDSLSADSNLKIIKQEENQAAWILKW